MGDGPSLDLILSTAERLGSNGDFYNPAAGAASVYQRVDWNALLVRLGVSATGPTQDIRRIQQAYGRGLQQHLTSQAAAAGSAAASGSAGSAVAPQRPQPSPPTPAPPSPPMTSTVERPPQQPVDWWASRSEREQHGMLISGAGVVAAVIGLVLLPWFEAEVAGTTGKASFAEVMRALDNISSELAPLERLVIGRGLIVPLILAAVGLFNTWAAFVGYRTKTTNERVTVTWAAVMDVGVAAYLGWVVYAANREVAAFSADLFAFGIDYRIGVGAWVTIAGIVVVAAGLLYSSPASAAVEQSQPAGSGGR